MKIPVSLAVCCLLIVALAAPAAADEGTEEGKAESVVLTARVVDSMGSVPGRSSARMKMVVDGWSSDEDVIRLVKILVEQGQKPLYEALRDMEKIGHLSINNRLAQNIVVARSLAGENGKGRVVRLLLNRPITFFEAVNKLRLEDYPFGFVEMTLDENGEGEGQLFGAARIAVSEEGLSVESYGVKPLRMLKVKLE